MKATQGRVEEGDVGREGPGFDGVHDAWHMVGHASIATGVQGIGVRGVHRVEEQGSARVSRAL